MEDDDEFGDLYTDILPLLSSPHCHSPTPLPITDSAGLLPRVSSSVAEEKDEGFRFEIPGLGAHGGDEDWPTAPDDVEEEDSESEDDLKIVLNDASVRGPGMGLVDDNDEEEQKNENYVRPGAAPLPRVTTARPEGAPSQVHPPLSMNLMAGRGRGDWWPVGIKSAPLMFRGFHPGFAWGNNMGGRGFGVGLDFTLPSYKTIFEVDNDSFEENPWKYLNVDMSDFFNFGLNEDSWKDYCKQLVNCWL